MYSTWTGKTCTKVNRKTKRITTLSLFDQYAQNYNEGHAKAVKSTGFQPSYFHEYKIKEMFARLKDRGLHEQDLSLLNVGCGIGESEPYIREYLPRVRVYGIDVSEKCVEVARETHKELQKVTYAPYDGEHIPFEMSFDIIFVAGVFHHIRWENHLKTLRIREKLKDGGLIFLFELNPLNPLSLWIAYKNDYRFDRESRLLSPRYTRRYPLGNRLQRSRASLYDLFSKSFFLPAPPGKASS